MSISKETADNFLKSQFQKVEKAKLEDRGIGEEWTKTKKGLYLPKIIINKFEGRASELSMKMSHKISGSEVVCSILAKDFGMDADDIIREIYRRS